MAAGFAAITPKLVIATHNPGKLAEFRSLLAGFSPEIISAGELGLPEPEEISDSFAGNAQLKARAAATAAGLPALADDSGLCVAALGGAPGIYSARYAAGDYPAAFGKILAAADETGERRARFVCALCLAQPDGTTATYIGQADGKIAASPAGAAGFGYDAIFIPDGHAQTYAELGSTVKDQISHRARALEQFLAAVSPI
jgi:XTP/dITP diphosphohydrolase